MSTALKALMKGVQANGKEDLSDDGLDEIVRGMLLCRIEPLIISESTGRPSEGEARQGVLGAPWRRAACQVQGTAARES